jgi:hypothetical protein
MDDPGFPFDQFKGVMLSRRPDFQRSIHMQLNPPKSVSFFQFSAIFRSSFDLYRHFLHGMSFFKVCLFISRNLVLCCVSKAVCAVREIEGWSRLWTFTRRTFSSIHSTRIRPSYVTFILSLVDLFEVRCSYASVC